MAGKLSEVKKTHDDVGDGWLTSKFVCFILY